MSPAKKTEEKQPEQPKTENAKVEDQAKTPEEKTEEKQPEEEKTEEAPKDEPSVVGTQHFQLISRDENGSEIKAMSLGNGGVLVSTGIAMAFVPNGDIVSTGAGLEIRV